MIRNELDVNRVGESALGPGGVSPVIAPTFVSSPAAAPLMSAMAPLATAPVAGLGGTGFGSGGFLEAALLLGILGGNRNGLGIAGAGTDVVSAQNVSELRKDVADSAAEVHKLGNEIQSSFALQTATLSADFRNLDNQICESDKNAIRAQYEAKIASLQSTNEITNKIDFSTADLKNQLFGLATNVASEFCSLRHQIESGNAEISLQAERNHNATTLQIERSFCKLEENRLRDEIAALREERECSRRREDSINNSLIMSQQTNSILNAMDSQLQRQTSQIVQFGTGNGAVSTPTSTNNQVS